MSVRSLVLAALMVLGGSAAYAESESNNLAAVEVPAGSGVYYNNAGPVQAQLPSRAAAVVVVEAPVVPR